jgi:hypothetical protein
MKAKFCRWSAVWVFSCGNRSDAFRNQPPKALPPLAVGAGAAQVIEDDQYPLVGSAHPPGVVPQPVLQPGALLVVKHLLGSRLPDVNQRHSVEVGVRDLPRMRSLTFQALTTTHRFPPALPCSARAGAPGAGSSATAGVCGCSEAACATAMPARRRSGTGEPLLSDIVGLPLLRFAPNGVLRASARQREVPAILGVQS